MTSAFLRQPHLPPHSFKRLQHLPPRTQRSHSHLFKLSFIQHNNLLPLFTFKIRRILVQAKTPQPGRYIVQQRRIKIFFSLGSARARRTTTRSRTRGSSQSRRTTRRTRSPTPSSGKMVVAHRRNVEPGRRLTVLLGVDGELGSEDLAFGRQRTQHTERIDRTSEIR